MSFYQGKEILVEPYQYFHVTTKNLGEMITLDPSSSLIDFEDAVSSDEIEGDEFISFGPTVEDCLRAMPWEHLNVQDHDDPYKTRTILYVYTPLNSVYMYHPEHIDDWQDSGELRSDDPVQCKRVGVLSLVFSKIGSMFKRHYKYRMKIRWIKKD